MIRKDLVNCLDDVGKSMRRCVAVVGKTVGNCLGVFGNAFDECFFISFSRSNYDFFSLNVFNCFVMC